jgi:hypothetical protein
MLAQVDFRATVLSLGCYIGGQSKALLSLV